MLLALPVTRASGISASEIAEAQFLPAARWNRLRIWDRAYFRDLRAGELCERFNRLYLVTGATIRDEVPTYRGEGKAFLWSHRLPRWAGSRASIRSRRAVPG